MKTFSIAILFVCLSAAFKLLNSVTDRYNSGEKILVQLEALGQLKLHFHTLSNNKQDDMRNFFV